MVQTLPRLRRSVLFVPASNERAIAKIASLACDAIIFDLEDAVAPEAKAAARENLRVWFSSRPQGGPECIIRINPLASEWGAEDLAAAIACKADAILLPKIDTPRDIHDVDDALDEADAPEELRLWVMIETAKALLNIGALAEFGRDRSARLNCFVAGTNDLVAETGIMATPDRRYLAPWLMQMVLAARAGGLDVLDSVSNDFSDLDSFGRECAEAAAMGFDGKTLIHPAQIDAANRAFSPSGEKIATAEKIVAAFALPENTAKAVISIDGRMVERLHLVQAERLLEKASQASRLQP
jgi:citrate lyase subunit beta/citryl-CoA lyase